MFQQVYLKCTLCVAPPDTAADECCLSKMQGNVLYLEQFLQSIVDNQLLRFSLPHRRWEWDLDLIQFKCMLWDGLLDLMIQRMRKLPQGVQNALKVLSSLGLGCAKSTLQLLIWYWGRHGRQH